MYHFIVEFIPRAVLAPILIFVAFDIIAQSFQACPARHAPAVAFRILSYHCPAACHQIRESRGRFS